jgi:hypothetical protein
MHIESRFIIVSAGQHGPVALVQDVAPQSTVAPAAIVGCVQFGLVAEYTPGLPAPELL